MFECHMLERTAREAQLEYHMNIYYTRNFRKITDEKSNKTEELKCQCVSSYQVYVNRDSPYQYEMEIVAISFVNTWYGQYCSQQIMQTWTDLLTVIINKKERRKERKKKKNSPAIYQ